MPEPAIACTIDELVRSRAAQHGSKPVVIDPESRISYDELDSTTQDLAAVFIHAGVSKGTRVGLIMPNSVRWVRVAAVQFLVTVEEFRGHRYLEDLQTVQQPELPALRQVWTIDRLARASGG